MSRSIDSSLQTDLSAAAATLVALIELQFGGGTTRITTAVQTLGWNSQTWTAVGGALAFPSGIPESSDPAAAGLPVELSGVDQSILALLLQEEAIGRTVKVWYAHLNATSGAVVGTPLLIFQGTMDEDWAIEESRPDPPAAGTVTISTRFTSRLATLDRQNAVRCNVESHNAMLVRSGDYSGTDDTFFQQTALVAGTPVYWGVPNAGGATQSTPSIPGGGYQRS